MSLEKTVESVKSDVGCLTYIMLIFVVLWLVNTINHGNVHKLLAEQNGILKQILQYQVSK